MEDKKQLEIISEKLDISLKAIAVMPLFIASLHEKRPNRLWKEAIKEWEKIEQQYEKLIEYEHNNNTADKQDSVS